MVLIQSSKMGCVLSFLHVFLSSAIGSKFPAGYPVGRVTHVEKKEHNPFLTIELAPSQTIEQF
jgi:rod shape-determining protein MreC